MRVLLVDDNPHDRGLVARQLRKEYSDLRLLEATNQNQLDELLEAGQFEVVITDFALRWSNGLAVLQQVKARWPHCPVIMFTATGSESIATEAMKAGLNDYIVKSAKHAVRLRSAVRSALQRVETEENLRRREAELAHVTRLTTMGELVAGLAHELNQPLAAIANYCTTNLLALEDADSPAAERVRENCRSISEQADRAADILGRVRAFLDRRAPVHATVQLDALLEESVHLVDYVARQAGVRIDLSRARGVFAVEVDRVQIQQVVINLLRNAFDAMADTPPENRLLRITTDQQGDRVVVAIHDRGHGLPETGAEELFQPFVTGKPGGMGMGLAVSSNLVSQHGDRLTTENNEHGGATFRFSLPLAPES